MSRNTFRRRPFLRPQRANLRLEQLEDRLVLDASALTLDALVVPTSANEGQTVSFTGLASNPSANGSITYAWNFGDGSSQSAVNLTDPTHTYLVQPGSPTDTVTLTVSDSSGSVSDTRQISIIDLPPTANAGPSQTVYAGAAVSFQGTATDPGGPSDIASVQWDFNYNGQTLNPDPGAAGNLNPSKTFTTPGTYLVALQVTDKGGNVDTDVTSVVVKPADALLVNAGPNQSVTTGTPVSFNGSYSYPAGTVSSGGIAWDFNYNGSSFNPMTTGTLTPSYTFSAAGSYQVALQVTAADGTQDISVLQATAAAPTYTGPTASAGSNQTVNEGSSLTFNGSYTDPDGTVSPSGIAWDFNYDGATFTPMTTGTLTPTEQFSTPGTQQVALQITDSHGLTSLSVLNVTVNSVAPTVSITNGPSLTVNAGDTVNLQAMASDPGGSSDPLSLAWDFNYNGTTLNPGQATGNSVFATFLSPGSYTVAVQATSASGASSMATLPVTVLASHVPVVNLGPDQTANLGDTVNFSASVSDSGGTVDPTWVDWDFNYDGHNFVADPGAHGTLTPTYQFDQPGLFLVAMRALDSNALSGVGVAYVNVADVPPDVNPGSDLTVAEGTPVTFQGTVSDVAGPNTMIATQWDFNYDGVNFNPDPSADDTLTPTTTYTAPGVYTVALRASDPWGGSTLETMTVTVTGVAPTATVTNSGPASEGSPATFTVANVHDIDSQASLSYAAQWTAGGPLVQIGPDELTTNPDGSVSFRHVYDTASGPSGYAVTIEVQDSDGGSTSYAQNVVVNAVAPTASFGPSGGATTVAAGLSIQFGNVSDPSDTEMQAGFTYYYSVNGGAYSSSSSPQLVLPDYTPGLNYTVSGYLTNAEGVSSPVYTTSVTTGAAQTIIANAGSGTVLIDGTTTLGPNQYLLTSGIDSNLHVTLETSGAAYNLYTNGNFGTVDAAAGVAAVNLAVHTDTLPSQFLSGLSPAPGSLTVMGPVTSDGNGDVGLIDLPAGNAGVGPSTLTVGARGNLGGIAGPSGSSSKLWAQASSLVFANLNGSITGLDSIQSLQASGSLGRNALDQVWANGGIGSLSAFSIPGTVTADRNYDLSDLATALTVGLGGIGSTVDLGNMASATIGGAVNLLKINRLEGNFTQQGRGSVNLEIGGTSSQNGAPPSITDSGAAAGDTMQIFALAAQAKTVQAIRSERALKVEEKGPLTVRDSITAPSITSVTVQDNLTATDILATQGAISKLNVWGSLTASLIQGATGIGTIDVSGIGAKQGTQTLQANGIIARNGDIGTVKVVTGDLKASLQAMHKDGSAATVSSILVEQGNFVLPDKSLVVLGNTKFLVVVGSPTGVLGVLDKLEVSGNLGKDVLGPGYVMAAQINRLEVKQGNLYAFVRSFANANGQAGIGSILVKQGAIYNSTLAHGGNIALVDAKELALNSKIEAERGGTNNGGSIAEVQLATGLGSILAQNFLGTVNLKGAKPSAVSITAQAGAKFDDKGNLTLQGNAPVLQALLFTSAAAFDGSITFSYGTGLTPTAWRVQFAAATPPTPLLTATIQGATTKWVVKRTFGRDAAVNLRNAKFTGGKFLIVGVLWATELNSNADATADWTISR